MRESIVLVTGSSGEVGHGLVEFLGKQGDRRIVAMDIQPQGHV